MVVTAYLLLHAIFHPATSALAGSSRRHKAPRSLCSLIAENAFIHINFFLDVTSLNAKRFFFCNASRSSIILNFLFKVRESRKLNCDVGGKSVICIISLILRNKRLFNTHAHARMRAHTYLM